MGHSQKNAADITSGKRRDRHHPKKHATSRRARAELQFPVSRVDRHLRDGHYAERPVLVDALFSSLASSSTWWPYLLELASKEADNRHGGRITSQDMKRMVENNLQPLHGLLSRTPVLEMTGFLHPGRRSDARVPEPADLHNSLI
ncbi:histone H2A-Bbd type 1-like [Saccopteryx leptura]|uniref:histone H2A-Bbd type 1-like n=1 Tax=Saccopteryx leptura TaxID=249018 RepID=UPI00339C5DD2